MLDFFWKKIFSLSRYVFSNSPNTVQQPENDGQKEATIFGENSMVFIRESFQTLLLQDAYYKVMI